MPAKAKLRLVGPAIEKRAVAPLRRPNSAFRTREHLTEAEVERLIETAKGNRYGQRDATMILVAYRHGLRAGEVCDLRWDQVDWNSATLHVSRKKSGKPSTHPIRGDELRALRRLHRDAPKSPFLFMTERGGPFTTTASTGWSSAREQRPSFHSRFMPTCCAMPLAISSRATATIPARSRIISGTKTSSIPSVIRSYRRRASKTFGAIRPDRREARSYDTILSARPQREYRQSICPGRFR
jgi:hypothetical protein